MQKLNEEQKSAIRGRLMDYVVAHDYVGSVSIDDISPVEIINLEEAIGDEFNLNLLTDETKDELTDLIYEDLQILLEDDDEDEDDDFDEDEDDEDFDEDDE